MSQTIRTIHIASNESLDCRVEKSDIRKHDGEIIGNMFSFKSLRDDSKYLISIWNTDVKNFGSFYIKKPYRKQFRGYAKYTIEGHLKFSNEDIDFLYDGVNTILSVGVRLYNLPKCLINKCKELVNEEIADDDTHVINNYGNYFSIYMTLKVKADGSLASEVVKNNIMLTDPNEIDDSYLANVVLSPVIKRNFNSDKYFVEFVIERIELIDRVTVNKIYV